MIYSYTLIPSKEESENDVYAKGIASHNDYLCVGTSNGVIHRFIIEICKPQTQLKPKIVRIVSNKAQDFYLKRYNLTNFIESS